MPQSTKAKPDRNNCPSGRKKQGQVSAQKNSGRESNQKLTHRSSRAISKRTGNGKQGEEDVPYVVNPVMVGAMQQTSKFDN